MYGIAIPSIKLIVAYGGWTNAGTNYSAPMQLRCTAAHSHPIFKLIQLRWPPNDQCSLFCCCCFVLLTFDLTSMAIWLRVQFFFCIYFRPCEIQFAHNVSVRSFVCTIHFCCSPLFCCCCRLQFLVINKMLLLLFLMCITAQLTICLNLFARFTSGVVFGCIQNYVSCLSNVECTPTNQPNITYTAITYNTISDTDFNIREAQQGFCECAHKQSIKKQKTKSIHWVRTRSKQQWKQPNNNNEKLLMILQWSKSDIFNWTHK